MVSQTNIAVEKAKTKPGIGYGLSIRELNEDKKGDHYSERESNSQPFFRSGRRRVRQKEKTI